MSTATATMPMPSIELRSLAIPSYTRAGLLRRAAFVAGSTGFAVAVWTLLAAIMVLG